MPTVLVASYGPTSVPAPLDRGHLWFANRIRGESDHDQLESGGERRMASKLKIKVNGLVHSVTASLDTPCCITS
jgi:hypothetical protein